MATSELLWRTLNVGDRVQIIHFPVFEGPLHEETRIVYQQLVDQHITLTVDRIDEDGYPWVEYFDEATEHYHFLMINHNGLELVANRR